MTKNDAASRLTANNYQLYALSPFITISFWFESLKIFIPKHDPSIKTMKTVFLAFLFKASASSFVDIMAQLRRGEMTDAVIKQDFIHWFGRHLHESSKQVATDLNYLNHIIITTRNKKFIKGKHAKEEVMKEIEKAESVSAIFDRKFGSPSAFPLLLCKIKTLKVMYLKNVAIPSSLEKYTELSNLEELELHSCVIANLSCLLPANSKLKKLILHSCYILHCTIDVSRTPNLETLVINHTNMYDINKDIFMLKNLKKIDLKDNHLSALPVFDDKDALTTEELILTRNIFEKFPSNINSFKKLKKLDLSKNIIQKFEKDFEFDESLVLEELNLAENLVKELPKNLENLQKVKSINLSSNLLTKIDPEIFRFQTIEKLNLSLNQLEFIDESLPMIPREIFKFTRMVSGNTPVNLKELDLSYNSLLALPNSISSFVSLEKLNIEGNQFKSIPDQVYNLLNLHVFNASFNKIREIPSWLARLPYLYELNLAGGTNSRIPTGPTNEITKVPMLLVDRQSRKVIKITLKGNPIQDHSTINSYGKIDLIRNYRSWIIF
ncbi:uncharacterized protein VICG_01458 [Vittaforma corneae ATCC 50505]|uniref:Uncharacterized protein n=1 Tax=Vittaforma corneae (strain ATCC 50505) TaxID=993615 RepID=L2GLF4_VITCO|nr:uncharacterized protein VICG_01458 [Vittaforma corneae ATCC 50505]ELA41474.1 hypothetical protein VICG_01458 [Vittaforma corneae ATCC 50505]